MNITVNGKKWSWNKKHKKLEPNGVNDQKKTMNRPILDNNLDNLDLGTWNIRQTNMLCLPNILRLKI